MTPVTLSIQSDTNSSVGDVGACLGCEANTGVPSFRSPIGPSLTVVDPWNRRPQLSAKITLTTGDTRGIEAEFGTEKALSYLIGEKFINFLAVAVDNATFRREIPAFVAEIRTIFEPWQLAEFLEIAKQTEPFDAEDYHEADDAEMKRQLEFRSATELLPVERAREWLLEDNL